MSNRFVAEKSQVPFQKVNVRDISARVAPRMRVRDFPIARHSYQNLLRHTELSVRARDEKPK